MELFSIVIALVSLLVAYIVYRENAIADVVVYAQADLSRPSVINLVIHNIGKGTARDIEFITQDGIPKGAYGISKLSDPKEVYSNGAFVTGLPILFPGERLVFSWGQFGGLKEALNNMPLEIKIIFKTKLALQPWSQRKINKVKIDIGSFEGISIAQPLSHTEIKDKLEQIANAIAKLK